MNITCFENEPLAPYCSMKAGGRAKYILLPKTKEELVSAIAEFKKRGERYIVVGNCSNLLFPESGFDGAVIITSGMRGVEVNGKCIKASCGETLSTLARAACENSLTGLEFCYGIPGTVGGGVYMNAGAYGGELSQVFVRGEFIDENGNIIVLNASEMDFAYRHSIMSGKSIVLLSAEFECTIGNKEDIRAKMDELMAKRKASQPLEYPSCGSAFKRPVGHYAGALIEQCGLKGLTVGGAQVSEKHAGFIINRGNASADDVIELLNLVSDTVFEKTGVRLEPEIRIIL